jgi:hypothetical protein
MNNGAKNRQISLAFQINGANKTNAFKASNAID